MAPNPRSTGPAGKRLFPGEASVAAGRLTHAFAITGRGARVIEDNSAEGEQRFVSIGMNVFGHLRVVVYSLRGDDARIISVRKPKPKEVRAYEEGV